MSRFTGPLAVTFLAASSGLAHLDQALVWECGKEGSGRTVEVPRGFVSDGITAPRFAWWFLPPWGHGATRAAVLHDWGLDRLAAGVPLPDMPTRQAVDAEFHLALLACGVSRPLAAIMWAAVRFTSVWSATKNPGRAI